MNSPKHLIYLLFLAFACTQAPKERAQTLTKSTPEEAGMISDTLNKIIPHLQYYMDSAYIAGGVVLIAKDNKLVYQQALGFSDRTKSKALQLNHIFRMASMTKPITSVAIMQLYEQGMLKLHDPVSKYIPEFANPKIVENFNKEDSTYNTRPASKEVTIHHLLTHTSGIAYGVFHSVAGPVYAEYGITEAWTTDSITLAMNIPKMGPMPLMHEPGERFTYGTGIDVLGYIVEVVSGLSLDQYFKQHIFEPLGMDDTHFYLPDDKADRLVEMWFTPDFDSVNLLQGIRPDYPVSGAKTYFSGGAGLSGTADDYIQFTSAMLNNGSWNGAQILKPETVQLMMTNQIGDISLSQGEQFGYGGAVYTSDGPFGRKKGRWHWGGYWQTEFWVDPARNITVVILTNAFYSPKSREIYSGIEKLVNNSVM